MARSITRDDHIWRIGDVVVRRVVEVQLSVDPVHLLPDATPDALAKYDWLRPWALNDDGTLALPVQSFCIEADGKKIIVDTCFGPGPLPDAMAQRCNDGSFLEELTQVGFGRDDVDFVVNTHMHVDHVGWNTMTDATGALVPTFPNARYLVVRAEYEHWKSADEADRTSHAVVMFEASIEPLFTHGVAEIVNPDHAIADSVRLRSTPGHTSGHVVVMIESGGEKALITGDSVHSPVQFAEPAWHAGIDLVSSQSIETRRRLIGELVDADVLVLGSHFASPTAGHVVSTPNGVRFRPLVSAIVEREVESRSNG